MKRLLLYLAFEKAPDFGAVTTQGIVRLLKKNLLMNGDLSPAVLIGLGQAIPQIGSVIVEFALQNTAL